MVSHAVNDPLVVNDPRPAGTVQRTRFTSLAQINTAKAAGCTRNVASAQASILATKDSGGDKGSGRSSSPRLGAPPTGGSQ
jgi:hypothetical protein